MSQNPDADTKPERWPFAPDGYIPNSVIRSWKRKDKLQSQTDPCDEILPHYFQQVEDRTVTNKDDKDKKDQKEEMGVNERRNKQNEEDQMEEMWMNERNEQDEEDQMEEMWMNQIINEQNEKNKKEKMGMNKRRNEKNKKNKKEKMGMNKRRNEKNEKNKEMGMNERKNEKNEKDKNEEMEMNERRNEKNEKDKNEEMGENERRNEKNEEDQKGKMGMNKRRNEKNEKDENEEMGMNKRRNKNEKDENEEMGMNKRGNKNEKDENEEMGMNKRGNKNEKDENEDEGMFVFLKPSCDNPADDLHKKQVTASDEMEVAPQKPEFDSRYSSRNSIPPSRDENDGKPLRELEEDECLRETITPPLPHKQKLSSISNDCQELPTESPMVSADTIISKQDQQELPVESPVVSSDSVIPNEEPRITNYLTSTKPEDHPPPCPSPEDHQPQPELGPPESLPISNKEPLMDADKQKHIKDRSRVPPNKKILDLYKKAKAYEKNASHLKGFSTNAKRQLTSQFQPSTVPTTTTKMIHPEGSGSLLFPDDPTLSSQTGHPVMDKVDESMPEWRKRLYTQIANQGFRSRRGANLAAPEPPVIPSSDRARASSHPLSAGRTGRETSEGGAED